MSATLRKFSRRYRKELVSAMVFIGEVMLAVLPDSARADIGDGNWYFFGDSAAGQGNYSAVIGEVGEDFAPYSSNNGFQRESNGLIWTELMGRDVDIIADPDSDSPNINFAISGAHMTRGGDLEAFGIETGVRVQTEVFSQLVGGGDLAPGGDDVAFVIAGGNDFLDRLDAGDDAGVIVADVAQAAADNVTDLAATGLRTIILSQIQPIQFAPEFAGDIALQEELSALMEFANVQMLGAAAEAAAASGVNLVSVDYNAFVSYMVDNSEALGFTETALPCFNDVAGTLCSADIDGQNQFLFFDDLHFTESAQRLEAQWWLATLNGASGAASRQTSRMPDVLQYAQEQLRRSAIGRTGLARPRRRVFAEALYASPRLDGQGADPDVSIDLTGGTAGAEFALSQDVFVGGAGSFSQIKGDFSGGGGFSAKTYAAHGWSGYAAGPVLFTVDGLYGWSDLGGIGRPTGVDFLSARGKTDGQFWDVGISAETAFSIHEVTLTARGGYRQSEVTLEGYEERGADGLALAYGDQTKQSRRVEFEVEAQGEEYRIAPDGVFRPVVGAKWRHELSDGNHRLVSALIDNTADPAVIWTGGTAQDRLEASFGFDLECTDGSMVSARYIHGFGDDLRNANQFTLSARITF